MKIIKNSLLFFVFSFCIITLGAENKKITKLGKPNLIQGKNGFIKNGDHGFAYPTVYDWNQDGKKDLIVGEFSEKARFKVYLNEGTDAEPKFSGKFFYGKDIKGNPLFVETC